MNRQMDQKGVVAGLFFLVFGLAIAVGAASYPFKADTGIGPGFFPSMVGIALAITGIVQIGAAMGPGATPTRFDRRPLKPILFTTGGVVVFALLLKPGGLILALPALFLCLALAQSSFSWRRLVGVSLVLLPSAWLIFIAFLGMPIRFLPDF